LETVSQYVESGYGKILRGEIGRFEGVRLNVLVANDNGIVALAA